jgi:hypothetical protein
MRRPRLAAAAVILALTAACTPPRERVAGRSADGRTAVELDLSPASGDSVLGTGTLRVAGRPTTVVLHGRWREQDNGLRRLDATLQSDTVPGERWSLDWSPVSLDGSIRRSDDTAVALLTLE